MIWTHCCSHRNVINHADCTQAEATLKWFCVFQIFASQQSIVHKQFCPRKEIPKNYVEDSSGVFLSWLSVYMYNLSFGMDRRCSSRRKWQEQNFIYQWRSNESVNGSLSYHTFWEKKSVFHGSFALRCNNNAIQCYYVLMVIVLIVDHNKPALTWVAFVSRSVCFVGP